MVGDSNRHVHKVGQRFSGIQRFTAADTQHRQAVGAIGQLFQAIDFILRTFAAKRCNFDVQFRFLKLSRRVSSAKPSTNLSPTTSQRFASGFR
jgi:hypothetical protein